MVQKNASVLQDYCAQASADIARAIDALPSLVIQEEGV